MDLIICLLIVKKLFAVSCTVDQVKLYLILPDGTNQIVSQHQTAHIRHNIIIVSVVQNERRAISAYISIRISHPDTIQVVCRNMAQYDRRGTVRRLIIASRIFCPHA